MDTEDNTLEIIQAALNREIRLLTRGTGNEYIIRRLEDLLSKVERELPLSYNDYMLLIRKVRVYDALY